MTRIERIHSQLSLIAAAVLVARAEGRTDDATRMQRVYFLTRAAQIRLATEAGR